MKSVLMFAIIVFSIIVINADANDFSESDWHDATVCNPCHESILPESTSDEIYSGCKCHYLPGNPDWNTRVDIQSIKKIHGSKPCLNCHINSMGTITQDNLHRLHIAIECGKCHGNEKVIKPDFLECFTCHESEIHGVHDDLESLCVICHGKFGADTVNKFKSASMPVSSDVDSLPENEKRDFPTIIEVIRALYHMIRF